MDSQAKKPSTKGSTPLYAKPGVIAAGATALVAGSAVFTGDPDDYADNIRALRQEGESK